MSTIRKIVEAAKTYRKIVKAYEQAYFEVYYDELAGIRYVDPTDSESKWLSSLHPRNTLSKCEAWASSSYDVKAAALALYARGIFRRNHLRQQHGKDKHILAVGYCMYLDGTQELKERGAEILQELFPNSWCEIM